MRAAIRKRFPGWPGLVLVGMIYAAMLLAILLCLDAPEAPFAYGNL